ncbi:MAG TPA: hypothetical protein VNN80_04730, partial [Polyangiaceae bacterium]|nr:hypothetical protein [Polyangiaceae bacterium]
SGGVCCEGACDGTCEQCDESGSCVPIDDCDCDPGDTSTCGTAIGSRGDCASFPITCTADRQWPTQQCNPRSAEQCNSDGRDEDCNGESRNGCQCINDTIGNCGRDLGARGVCADRDLAFCTGGRWPSEQCQPTSNEICGNGLDDNCNGQTDESPPCNVFDPSACQFFVRPECDEERCSRCQGCFDCEDIVNCVADNPDCVTAADPICGDPGNACESVVLGIQFPELEPLEAARDYITCSCTR